MNRTSFDQDNILYEKLNGSTQLKAAITGDVYKMIRPDGSKKEDVVINTISVLDGSIQLGVSNVNIHVADIDQSNGTAKYKAPDTSRLKQLTDIIYPLLEDVFGSSYRFWIASQSTIREPETKQHYVNLRINFRHHHSQY